MLGELFGSSASKCEIEIKIQNKESRRLQDVLIGDGKSLKVPVFMD